MRRGTHAFLGDNAAETKIQNDAPWPASMPATA